MVASLVCLERIIACERMHVLRHRLHIHSAHHGLERFHAIGVEMSNLLSQSSKECKFPSECAKELISAPFTTIMSNWYKLDSNEATANISPLLALTTHPNELKCTFKPLEMSLLIESKFECKSGT
jgi:hypothetical protein